MSLIINAPKELCKTISSNTISSFTSDEPIPSTSSSLSGNFLQLKNLILFTKIRFGFKFAYRFSMLCI